MWKLNFLSFVLACHLQIFSYVSTLNLIVSLAIYSLPASEVLHTLSVCYWVWLSRVNSELIFSIAACGVPCFVFVLEAVLVIQKWLRYCRAVLTQNQGLFGFSPRSSSEEAGSVQGAGMEHSQDS